MIFYSERTWEHIDQPTGPENPQGVVLEQRRKIHKSVVKSKFRLITINGNPKKDSREHKRRNRETGSDEAEWKRSLVSMALRKKYLLIKEIYSFSESQFLNRTS